MRFSFPIPLFLLMVLVGCGGNSNVEVPSFEAMAVKGTDDLTVTESIDHVREFVNHTTRHEPEESEFDPSEVEAYSVAVAQAISEGSTPPNLKCGHRSRLMMRALSRLGIKSRLINFLAKNDDYLDGHTLLEAFNTQTNSWEVADPDLNVYYSDGSNRLSLRDLVDLGPANFLPCRETCSWSLENENLVDGDFDLDYLVTYDFYAVGLIHSGAHALPVTDEKPHMYMDPSRFTDQAWDRLNGKTAVQYYVTDVNGTLETL